MCVPIPIHISLLITELDFLVVVLPRVLFVVVVEAESQLSFTTWPLEVSEYFKRAWYIIISSKAPCTVIF